MTSSGPPIKHSPIQRNPMKAAQTPISAGCRIIFVASCMISFTWVTFGKSVPSTAAFSEISPNYHRKMLPTGKYEPETYALGKGICVDKSGRDSSLTTLSFREIGALLADALAKVDYVPTPSPEETDLVIVVNWGRTMPFDRGMANYAIDSMSTAINGISQIKAMVGSTDPQSNTSIKALQDSMASEYSNQMDQMLTLYQMEEDRRLQADTYNARLLGYGDEMNWAAELVNTSMTMRSYHHDLMIELENPRYFVILQAYDFQKMWKEKKKVLLWTTRFSIRAKGHKFDEELQNMALAASRTFGTDSDKLKRGLRPAEVKFGELEYIGVVEE